MEKSYKKRYHISLIGNSDFVKVNGLELFMEQQKTNLLVLNVVVLFRYMIKYAVSVKKNSNACTAGSHFVKTIK